MKIKFRHVCMHACMYVCLYKTRSLLLIFTTFLLTFRTTLILIISLFTLFLLFVVRILILFPCLFFRCLWGGPRIELRLIQLLRKVHHQKLLGEVDLRLQVEGATLLCHILLMQYLESLHNRAKHSQL